jgi:acyl dehydratase
LTINAITAAKYKLGDSEPRLKKTVQSHIITESMLDEFAKLPCDYSPLHTNEQYTQTTNFSLKICHGLLLASFFYQLIGVHLPGKNAHSVFHIL